MIEMNFSIIFPSRFRPERLKRACASVFSNATHPELVECIVRIDNDDRKTLDAIGFDNKSNIVFVVGKPLGYMGITAYFSEAVKLACGKWIIHINDDVAFETPGWDDKIMAYPIDGKQILIPETDHLGKSHYHNNDGSDWFFAPNKWWVGIGISEFVWPLEQWAKRTLLKAGWKNEFVPGLTIYHERDENDELMIYNRNVMKRAAEAEKQSVHAKQSVKYG